MGFTTAFKSFGQGEFHKGISALWVSEKTLTEGRDVDNRIDDFNKSLLEKGKISADQFNYMQNSMSYNRADNLLTNPESSPAAGLLEGAKEGFDAEISAVVAVKNKAQELAFAAIPWKLVAVIIVGAFLWAWFSKQNKS